MNLKRRDAESSSIDDRFEISELSQEKSTVPVLSASSAEKRARAADKKHGGSRDTHGTRGGETTRLRRFWTKQLEGVATGEQRASVGAASRVRVVVHKPEQIVLAE